VRALKKSSDLLQWYDHNARVLPWRVPPLQSVAGLRPDPYRVWLSEIMLQQTTVAAVKPYFDRFTQRWPTVTDLANAQDADVMAAWAGLGYYARARNLLKCARVIRDAHGGRFPDTEEALLNLPGVGPYTAAAVAAFAFARRAVVVDGNVERVMSRLFDVSAPLPDAKAQLKDHADHLTPSDRSGDYAQAVMDLGATICTPKNPACGICPWRSACDAWHAGTQAQRPVKKPKTPKPTRYGVAYVARRVDGALLLEERPPEGLLGGMMGLPTTAWAEEMPADTPPIRAEWKTSNTRAKHTFTHFHLVLSVKTALVPMDRTADIGYFLDTDNFDANNLPTLMRKVLDVAQTLKG
jgi:A/G-specific adenine glycosylase